MISDLLRNQRQVTYKPIWKQVRWYGDGACSEAQHRQHQMFRFGCVYNMYGVKKPKMLVELFKISIKIVGYSQRIDIVAANSRPIDDAKFRQGGILQS